MRRFAFSGLSLIVAGVAAAQQPPKPVPFPAGQPPAAGQPAAQPAAPGPLMMEDQWEHARDLSPYAGDVVVMLYGDRGGMAGSRALGEKLHVEFHPGAAGLTPTQARKVAVTPLGGLPAGVRSPDVHVVPVACIGKGVPNLVKTMIRNQIKKGSPEVPVWLDFDNAMQTRFGMKEGAANLVVFDGQGRPRFKVAGEPDAKQYARLVEVVQSLRAEAAASPPVAPAALQPLQSPSLPPTPVPPAGAPPITGPDLMP